MLAMALLANVNNHQPIASSGDIVFAAALFWPTSRKCESKSEERAAGRGSSEKRKKREKREPAQGDEERDSGIARCSSESEGTAVEQGFVLAGLLSLCCSLVCILEHGSRSCASAFSWTACRRGIQGRTGHASTTGRVRQCCRQR